MARRMKFVACRNMPIIVFFQPFRINDTERINSEIRIDRTKFVTGKIYFWYLYSAVCNDLVRWNKDSILRFLLLFYQLWFNQTSIHARNLIRYTFFTLVQLLKFGNNVNQRLWSVLPLHIFRKDVLFHRDLWLQRKFC